jgi:hypothetical protein
MLAATAAASIPRVFRIVEKNLFINNVPIALHKFVGVQFF